MNPQAILNVIAAVNTKFNLPEGLLHTIAWKENGENWNLKHNKRSYRGALGLFQLMPITLKQIKQIANYNVNPLDPRQAAYGAAAYLLWLYEKFGNWRYAIAAYNVGYGTVRKNLMANGDVLNEAQLPKETRDYLKVADILGFKSFTH